MARKLTYERYSWFHGRVKAGAFPNSARLADHFEISRKQAQRDIEFMRDRLGAPLLYNADRRGYEYEDGTYELPLGVSSWIAEQEWHEAQEVSVAEEGSLRLRFPVSSFVEVAREILKYGASVEVLESRELRDTIREEIWKMGTLYR